jgi:CDP-glucose 4,6-dehydratase
VNRQFWKNKKVFITGHTGFKGSWLTLWLSLLGAKIVGYALRPNTHPSLFDLANIQEHLSENFFADIRDISQVKAAIAKVQPDIIFHLAAQPLVRYSYENPVETYETNVMGTVNILDAMRTSNSAKVLVNITTDKCYENKEWHWGYRENDPMGGHDPYSNSKGCAELITSAYRSSYFNPSNFNEHGKSIASARAGNVIGGGDWAKDRLIPDLITAFFKNEKPLIRYPSATRPWQHVLEPLSGYLTLAEKMWNGGSDFAEAWNFGPRDADCQSVAWIINKISEYWDGKIDWLQNTADQHHEANFLKLDISKAKAKLAWQPRWTLSQALEKTVFWYKAWANDEDALSVTQKQILTYEEHLSSLVFEGASELN